MKEITIKEKINGDEKMNDKTSFEIKRKLKQAFPNETFSVRIDKYSGGSCIYVKTSALQKHPEHTDAVWRVEVNSNPNDEDKQEYFEYKKKREEFLEKESKIREVIQEYEKVSYDQYSGEILSGCNTFIDIRGLFK